MAAAVQEAAEVQVPFISVLTAVTALEKAAQEVTEDGAPQVQQSIAGVFQELTKLRDVADKCTGPPVPASFVSHVDEGGNPDELFVRTAVAASKANRDTKGRVFALGALRDALLDEARRWPAQGAPTT